jgi:hypothetical protein
VTNVAEYAIVSRIAGVETPKNRPAGGEAPPLCRQHRIAAGEDPCLSASYRNRDRKSRLSRINDARRLRSSIASVVKPPWRYFPLRFPFGAPLPAAPPCIRQRVLYYRRPLATGMASRASSALASVYWLARAAPRHKVNEGLAARFEHGCLPGEILPAHHCDVDISWMKLDRVACAAGHFRRNDRGA